MHCFVAVEIKPGEREIQGLKAFFTHASGIGLKFAFLEPYGPMTIGSTAFVRCKTDCPRVDELVPFFQDESRAFVLPGKAGYRIVTQTTEGVIPISLVQSAKLPGYNRRWRGTTNEFWGRQFPS